MPGVIVPIAAGASKGYAQSFWRANILFGILMLGAFVPYQVNLLPLVSIMAGIGIFLALSFLYRGIPVVMQPDPSNALGLFLFCSILLLGATGLAHFVAVLVLDEKLLA